MLLQSVLLIAAVVGSGEAFTTRKVKKGDRLSGCVDHHSDDCVAEFIPIFGTFRPRLSTVSCVCHSDTTVVTLILAAHNIPVFSFHLYDISVRRRVVTTNFIIVWCVVPM